MLLDDKHKRLLTRPIDELAFMIQALRHIIKMEQDENTSGRAAFKEFKLALKILNPSVYQEVTDHLMTDEWVSIQEYLSSQADDLGDRLAPLMLWLEEQKSHSQGTDNDN